MVLLRGVCFCCFISTVLFREYRSKHVKGSEERLFIMTQTQSADFQGNFDSIEPCPDLLGPSFA